MNISQSLFDYMKDYPRDRNTVALSYRGKCMTTVSFLQAVEGVAAALQESGIKKGDSVAILLPNIPEAVIALYAINRAGAVANVIHPKTNHVKIRAALRIADTKLVFCYTMLWSEQRKALTDEQVVMCGDFRALFGAVCGSSFGSFTGKNPLEPVEVDGEDIAVYMHSGGTMGEPKTVMLSNRAVNALVENMYGTIGKAYDKHDAMLVILPIFHGFGLAVSIHATLCKGMKAVLVPSFDPKRTKRLIAREKITVIAGIPRMFEKMLRCRNFSGVGLKTIEDVFCGGDYLREDTKREFEARLKEAGAKARFCQGYGLTETASVCVLNLDNTAGSIGKPFNNMEFRVLDDDGNPATRGKLWLSGTQCMSGYLHDDEATAATLKVEDDKLWLCTGDIVSADENCNLWFSDRAKRIIKISGINVFPSEVERCALECEDVTDACLVEKRVSGKPYSVLFVSVSHSDETLEKRVLQHCRANLSRWFVPRRVIVLPKLPTTSLGKTDVKFLEKLAENVSI